MATKESWFFAVYIYIYYIRDEILHIRLSGTIINHCKDSAINQETKNMHDSKACPELRNLPFRCLLGGSSQLASAWLIIMVSKFPKDQVVGPLPNGLFMAY